MTTQTIFSRIIVGDVEGVRKVLDGNPGLVHARQGDADDDWTTLQCDAEIAIEGLLLTSETTGEMK
jgi:hypothetical protein